MGFELVVYWSSPGMPYDRPKFIRSRVGVGSQGRVQPHEKTSLTLLHVAIDRALEDGRLGYDVLL